MPNLFLWRYTMCEIRQALNRNVNWRINGSSIGHEVLLIGYGNPHRENGDEITDIYTQGKVGAFGLPTNTIEDIYNKIPTISKNQGKFLIISGIDVIGNLRTYSFKITKEFLFTFIWQYVSLIARIHGTTSSEFKNIQTEWVKLIDALKL